MKQSDPSASERDLTVSERTELTRLREEMVRARELAAAADVEHARLLDEMRDANENLLRAAIRAEEMVEAASAARAAAASSELVSQAKDEFLAMLGHELRNPLAPMLTALELMKLRGDTTAWRERVVLERQLSHLVRLVDDLLDVSRITGGKIALRKRRLELTEVVTTAIEMTSPLIELRRHELIVSVASRGLEVDADAIRLAQVVSNLLANAAKYTEPAGTIEIIAARSGDKITLRVKDSGIGIEPEMVARIFDRFVQAPQALDRSQGGLGLGLTIVKSLVALHDGSVSVHSEGRDRGAEFCVELPVATSRHSEATSQRSPSTLARRGRDGSRRLVLVVDDNHDAAELLAEALQELGYETRVAHDGPTALRIVADARPDVALLDIGLPVMDGYELAGLLRTQAGLEDIRIVAMTGYGRPPDRERSAAAGFDAHLVKPIHLGQLQDVLEEAPATTMR